MTILYKLTTQDRKTRPGHPNEITWSEGRTATADGEGNLCGPGFIHAYTYPLLAVLLNPIHANYQNPLLWECEGEVAKTDHGLKVGCTSLTTLRVVDLPKITTEQRVRFAILCVLAVYDDPAFVQWAQAWLSGADRTMDAELAAEWATEWAAEAAEWAAEAAEWEWAAEAAEWAAEAAEWAAEAAEARADLDLIALAERAIAEETCK